MHVGTESIGSIETQQGGSRRAPNVQPNNKSRSACQAVVAQPYFVARVAAWLRPVGTLATLRMYTCVGPGESPRVNACVSLSRRLYL